MKNGTKKGFLLTAVLTCVISGGGCKKPQNQAIKGPQSDSASCLSSSEDVKQTFQLNGHTATVVIPANANGKWLWKTEFFYAYDAVEEALYEEGYIRVYYSISNKYGSPRAVELMYDFYQEMRERYNVEEKAYMVGFSRGGLYAFNFALAHPECVEKMYLDAPVLDLRSWPRVEREDEYSLHKQVMEEYGFVDENAFLSYGEYPVDNFEEYFALNIPTLLVAGKNDSTVAFEENAGLMIEYCQANEIPLVYYVKVGEGSGEHHPHSFGNEEVEGEPYYDTFQIYSSEIQDSSEWNLVEVNNSVSLIKWFFE